MCKVLAVMENQEKLLFLLTTCQEILLKLEERQEKSGTFFTHTNRFFRA